MIEKQTDIIVVGSGPGGATVARELARSSSGLAVTLLERGRDWRQNPLYGTYPGAMLYADRASFLFTQQGLTIIRPLMVGGATSMYCGCAARPLPWWQSKYGIDLNQAAEEMINELRIAPLPATLRGVASTRIADAAADLGLDWQPQDKFMVPQRSHDGFGCGAKCMLGCRCGAKWNAAEIVDEAVQQGIDLWTGAQVDEVLWQNGRVQGVRGRRAGKPFRLWGNTVVLAAGGIGTPLILQRSGLTQAGQGMTMDTTVMVYGHAPAKGIGQEPPMTWSCADDELGVLYSTLIDPWLNYPIVMLQKGPAYPLTWHRWGQTYGVMIKLKDEISGAVQAQKRGFTIDKGLTVGDQQRLAQAEAVAGRILRQAGCDPNTIFTTPLRGTHPSGTVRLGEMLDTNLQTEIAGLYVCDASVFPEALARPTVLTILALGKRLARHLAETRD
ncbi:MAG: GMC family oxidoreductase [Anaerolineales bacterium]|nr:GMC family oxidoreductase [Anaerolineales bacterium]